MTRLRDLSVRLLHGTGLLDLARRLLVRDGRFALNFHGVSARRYPDVPRDLQPHHSAAEFRRVLAWLAAHFSFLSVDEFLDAGRPGVLLTFDDGHANNLSTVLPLLAEFQAPGLFFISTQHVRDPRDWLTFTREAARRGWGSEKAVPGDFARDCFDGLSETELAELARSPWAAIGAHTVHHPSLPDCPAAQVLDELAASRQYLQDVTGQTIDTFAYPYGDYDLSVARAVETVGYRAAFAVNPLPVGLSRYEIPRVGIYAAQPGYLNMKLSGLHRRPIYGPVGTG